MSAHVITASDLDLLSFFEVEPKAQDEAEPWPYNDFLYETTRGRFHISFAVAPADRDVRFILSVDGQAIYELNAVGVADVRYSKDKQGELLEILVSSREAISLRLQPSLAIGHRIRD